MIRVTDTDINTQIHSLHALLSTKAAGVQEHIPSLLPYLADAERLASEYALTQSELENKAAAEDRVSMEEELAEATRRIRQGYSYLTGRPVPAWLKRAQKKDADYYAGFFAHIADERLVLEDYTDKTGKTLTNLRDLYQRWQSAVAQLDARSTVSQKIMHAFDLRASLIGMLRLAGASSSEIQEAME